MSEGQNSRLADLIEAATISQSMEDLEQASKEALSYLQNHTTDPEAYYMLGYLYFHYPDRTPEQSSQALQFLSQCLEKKPDHMLALYHLAMLQFLAADYSSSQATINKIDTDYFVTIAQEWRGFKIAEIHLACKLYLRERVGLDDFQKFQSLSKVFKDLAEMPILIEITNCLNNKLRTKTAPFLETQILDILCNLITQGRQQAIFLQKEGPFFDYLRQRFPLSE